MTWKSTGPLSYQGTSKARSGAVAPVLLLKVHPTAANDSLGCSGQSALMCPDDFKVMREFLADAPAFLQLASGSDCLSAVKADSKVARGNILLDAVARHNLHIVTGESYEFSVWEGPANMEELDLKELHLEVIKPLHLFDSEASQSQQLNSQDPYELHSDGLPLEVDARALEQLLLKGHTARMLSVNQLVSVTTATSAFLMRVSQTHSMDAAARTEAVGYHCYRGRLLPDTSVFFTSSDAVAACPMRLLNARQPFSDEESSPRVVEMLTNDGETFPVNKRLLRPCLALTTQVRSKERAMCSVNIDTLTFDRVLIFLECGALSRSPPNFGAHLLDSLLLAGQELRCKSLTSFCEDKLGSMEARIKVHRWEDVQVANASGQRWLVLDGMVLDVTDWLPEHPGGSSIIPEQALNLDCARFFEVYHASRESFLYLKEFYIGEVSALQRECVPVPEEPSPDFLCQLRSFTTWRISNRDEKTHKSF